jgi:hypothetical protein
MAAAQDKFIQIAVTATGSGVAPVTVLHALDVSGHVWFFDSIRGAWRMMSQTREE